MYIRGQVSWGECNEYQSNVSTGTVKVQTPMHSTFTLLTGNHWKLKVP